MKELSVLVVDDHPIIMDSYKMALKQIECDCPEFRFKIKTASDCDSADAIIENAVNGTPLDLVLLDIRLPASKNGLLTSGEDLGVKIRELFSKTKMLVFTSYTNNYRLGNILRHLDPDGLLIKGDTDYAELKNAIIMVLKDPPCYSKEIARLFRRQATNDFILDKIDRILLYQLSIGTRTKDLTDIVPLSISAIEGRKRKLKELFDANEKEDSQLLTKARERGFI